MWNSPPSINESAELTYSSTIWPDHWTACNTKTKWWTSFNNSHLRDHKSCINNSQNIDLATLNWHHSKLHWRNCRQALLAVFNNLLSTIGTVVHSAFLHNIMSKDWNWNKNPETRHTTLLYGEEWKTYSINNFKMKILIYKDERPGRWIKNKCKTLRKKNLTYWHKAE